MNEEQWHSRAHMQACRYGTVALKFAVAVDECYLIASTGRRFGYSRLRRAEKAVPPRVLERVSGFHAKNPAGLSNAVAKEVNSSSAIRFRAQALRSPTPALM